MLIIGHSRRRDTPLGGLLHVTSTPVGVLLRNIGDLVFVACDTHFEAKAIDILSVQTNLLRTSSATC